MWNKVRGSGIIEKAKTSKSKRVRVGGKKGEVGKCLERLERRRKRRRKKY